MNTNKNKSVASNKKAFLNFFITDRFEAGIALKGTEVKSIKNQGINISDSFARIINGEMILFNMHISPYAFGNINNCEPKRERKLLLHKREIKKINTIITQKGFAIVPLSVYIKQGKIKIDIGIGQGKNLIDKRDTLKRKTQEKEIQRELKKYK